MPDIEGTARSILRDWVSGRIPYYTSPPAAPAPGSVAANLAAAAAPLANVSASDVDSATLLTSFAPAFDLAALFGEADAVAFGGLSGTSVKGVRMDGVEGESEDANVGWITGDGDEEEEDEDEEMEAEDDGAINVDDLLEDDDMDEDEVPAPVVVAKKASKKSAKAAAVGDIVSVAPTGRQAKSVSFASKALGPTGAAAVSQKAKLFTPNDAEAPGSSFLLPFLLSIQY